MAHKVNRMWSRLLRLFLVFGIAQQQQQAWADDEPTNTEALMMIDSFELVYNPCTNIRQAGFVCVDCATLGYCMNINNQWQTIEMTTCQTEAGFYCNDEKVFGCTWSLQCQVPVRGKFFCQLPGTYPDPYDCRSYHECSSDNVDSPHRCTNGYAYSTLTQSCSMPTQSAACSEKQYNCSYVGQMGAWQTNASFYYVCQKEQQGDVEVFYPLLLSCQPNYVFNGRICVQQRQQLRIAELEAEVPHLLSEEEELTCPERQIVADLTNCKQYRFCSRGVWTTYTCADGSHFDAHMAVCRHGDCTTSPPSSNSASSKCRRLGMAADLTDCTKFYTCASLSEDVQHMSCPVGTAYEPEQFNCVSGSC